MTVERTHGRVDRYAFENEAAARSGAAAYISTPNNEAAAVRVEEAT